MSLCAAALLASAAAQGQQPRARVLTAAATRAIADTASGFRIVVSLDERRLRVFRDADTLLDVPVAVGTGDTLSYGRTRWTFATPRGVRYVLGKAANPLWIPPDWLYVGAARAHGLKLRYLSAGDEVPVSDGRRLAIRDGIVGLLTADTLFDELPLEEHIVFDGTLFVPPPSTRNRRVEGELGKYKLDLGDGYFLHGTPHLASIGAAATHGCIRLGDADIEWLYDHVPLGTRVYLY